MNFKDTLFSIKHTINCGGSIVNFIEPRIMGILNVTPDSFYSGSRTMLESDVSARVRQMISDGADIIDVGGYSSRPHAEEISEQEERTRLKIALKIIRSEFPETVISVDTFRSGIARFAVDEFGVQIINDISAGLLDMHMMKTVGSLGVAYVIMHMKGTPATMQHSPQYQDVVRELLLFFGERITMALNEGVKDIIVDPGFGFGKSLEDNYTLLRELKLFEVLGFPILVGISRKSMIYKPLELSPTEALNGTSALHALALNNRAKILRVHDVKEAKQIIKLSQLYSGSGT
jgi:dihydropteroate synthase